MYARPIIRRSGSGTRGARGVITPVPRVAVETNPESPFVFLSKSRFGGLSPRQWAGGFCRVACFGDPAACYRQQFRRIRQNIRAVGAPPRYHRAIAAIADVSILAGLHCDRAGAAQSFVPLSAAL